MLKLWNVFSDLVAFRSIFWTLLSVIMICCSVSRLHLRSENWILFSYLGGTPRRYPFAPNFLDFMGIIRKSGKYNIGISLNGNSLSGILDLPIKTDVIYFRYMKEHSMKDDQRKCLWREIRFVARISLSRYQVLLLYWTYDWKSNVDSILLADIFQTEFSNTFHQIQLTNMQFIIKYSIELQ